jgi:putative YhbY family RNA-binding protein
MIELAPAQRRALRARAHSLHPVVSISQHGLSASVLAEIDRSLKAHELIKVRLYGVEHADRGVLMAEICAGLEAAPVQQIGNLLVIFRAHPEERKPAPAAKTTPKDKARAGAKPAPGKPAAPRRRTRG